MSVGAYSYVPGPPLSAFVDLLWIVEDYAPPHAQEHRLPTGTMDLVIGLDQDDRLGSGISGAQSEFFLLDTSRPFSVMGAQFKPGGGFPFVEPPAGELHNLRVPLDVFWGRDGGILREQLLEVKTPQRRFRILEKALLEKAAGRLRRDPAVCFALNEFRRAPLVQPVTEQIGLSSRRFIQLFRDEVGLTPKLFCRIQRFQGALRAVERADDIDWSEIALSCGYYDQAHFIHDFRAFSGISPSVYVKDRSSRNHVAVRD